MSRRVQDNLVAVAVLCVFIGVIVMSLDYGPRARMIPVPLATLGIILIVLQIIWQNLRSTEELHVDLLQVLIQRAESAGTPSGDEGGAPKGGTTWRKEAVALGIVAILVALILLFGPIPAVFVFTGGYFLLSRHYSWLKGLVYTVVFTMAIYLLFAVALEVQLYHGMLAPVVERFR
jgi:hypothetical protein